MDQVVLAIRVVFSLAVVLAMMWGLSRVMRGRGGAVRTSNLDVVSRTSLGKRASVVVVRDGGRGLILGVTDQSVTLIGETELVPVAGPVERRTPVELTPDLVGEDLPLLAAVPDLAPAEAVAATAVAASATTGRRARHRASEPSRDGGLAGSVLSPSTWRQTAEALRERTARS